MPRQHSLVFYPMLAKLRSQIATGAVSPGDMLGTELQFGRRAHISRNSVRTAIDQLVTEGLVERRPGKGIFVKSRSCTRLIEIVLPELGGFWVDFARGAQPCSRAHSVKLRIFNAHYDYASDLQQIQQLADGPANAALIGSWNQPAQTKAILELARSNFPFVLVGQHLDNLDISSIDHDRYALGYLAGQELVRRGHRRIGSIGYLAGSLPRRVDGIRDAVNEAGVPFDRSLAKELPLESLTQPNDAAELEACVRQLLERADRPTAIVLQRDEHAARVYQIIRTLGLRIPADVSIVGNGNYEVASLLEPALTTIDLHAAEVGRAALEMLLNRLQDEQAIEHRVIPGHWVERASVAVINQ